MNVSNSQEGKVDLRLALILKDGIPAEIGRSPCGNDFALFVVELQRKRSEPSEQILRFPISAEYQEAMKWNG